MHVPGYGGIKDYRKGTHPHIALELLVHGSEMLFGKRHYCD